MSRDNKLIIAEEDDPRRCQGIKRINGDQCQYLADPGIAYCAKHKGMLDTVIKNKNKRNYNLTKFRSQIEEKTDNTQIKSIREEIGITRQVLETIINMCESEVDLILNSNKIADLVLRIEKLVTSCHKIERSTSQLLDKSALIQLSGNFIEIISDYLSPEQQNEVADKLVELISNVRIVDDNE
jgi:hypothetical protein